LDTTGATPDGDVIVAGSVIPEVGGAPQPIVAALRPTGSIDSALSRDENGGGHHEGANAQGGKPAE